MMKKKTTTTRKRVTITDKIIKEIGRLSALGFSNGDIAKMTGVAMSTLSKNEKIRNSIQSNRFELAKEISQTIKDNLFENNSMQVLLVKRLGLFNREVNIRKPNTAKQALDNLGTAIKLYADNEISESQLRTIEATSNSFIKGHEATELEDRLSKLEKVILERSK